MLLTSTRVLGHMASDTHIVRLQQGDGRGLLHDAHNVSSVVAKDGGQKHAEL